MSDKQKVSAFVPVEFWTVIGLDGNPPDKDWEVNLKTNRQHANDLRACLNRWAKKYGRDPHAPYRVAKVRIVEIK